MSLSDNYKPVKYIGNGVTKDFGFNFNMIDSAYCRVFLQDIETSEQTPKTIEVDYTLNFGDDGGYVSMKVAPTTEQYIVVYRDVSLDQKSDFRVGDTFSATKIEEEFDKQMAAIQQMEDGLNRSPKVAEGSNVNLTLPKPNARKALVWNETENGFVNSTVDVDESEAITQQYRDEAEAARDAAKASEQSAAQSAQSAANTVNRFDAHAAEKQNAYDTNAQQKQAAVDASAENARKWAVGTISEQPAGSAKYWAEQAKVSADGQLNENMITNCITKIPQDIKLELNDGTLTLKAGSKVYDGNGLYAILASDIMSTGAGTNKQVYVVYQKKGALRSCVMGESVDSLPPAANTSKVYYNTTDKKCYLDKQTWEECSFPFALCTSTTEKYVSIDQVFNLCGKIGDAIFINPGIEFLFANGFNTDGSYNSLKLTTSKLIVRELTQADKNLGIVHLVFYSTQAFGFGVGYKVVKNSSERKSQASGDGAYYYVEDENLTYLFDRTYPQNFVYLGYVDVPNNKLYIRRTIKLPNEQDIPKLTADNTFTGVNTFNKTIYCPTPPTTNNDKAIATTAWVRQVAALKDLSNVSSNIDYIIEQGGNSYQWYRIYKSGRLEQGGIYDNETNVSNIRKQITLLKPYQHQSYNITVTPMSDGGRGTVCGRIVSRTTLELQYNGDYGVIGETVNCRHLSWKTDDAKGN